MRFGGENVSVSNARDSLGNRYNRIFQKAVAMAETVEMLLKTGKCPTTEQLDAIVQGRWPADQLEMAWSHVENCSLCTAGIDTLNDPQSTTASGLLSSLKHVDQQRDESVFQIQNELECQAAVQRAMLGQYRESDIRGLQPIDQIGPYEFIRALGQGGMGSVYPARHDRLKKLVAIKLLPRERSDNPDWVERFDREMQAVAAIEHPHIVRAIDAGNQAEWHYLVMEFLDGLDVAQLARLRRQLPIEAACEIARQAALGLTAIHEIGLVHRDIKPSNLFVANDTASKRPMVKVLDLGLVLSDGQLLGGDERLTTFGHIMGTLAYMPPEQIDDCRAVHPRSDIYALGATLYRLLAGQSPHGEGRPMTALIRSISIGDVRPLSELRCDIPNELSELVQQMIAVDIDQRPETMRVVAERLAFYSDTDIFEETVRVAHVEATDSQSAREDHATATRLPLRLTGDSQSPPRRPVLHWLAFAGLPLGILAGVLITLATDRGTLTIQSDEPGIEVIVKQNEKVVDELRLETGSDSVKLYSGQYEIELTGAKSDGLQLSENKITLTRNAQAVVEVLTKTTQAGNQAVANGTATPPTFKGEPIEHWIQIVETERDPETLMSAVEAIKRLAFDQNSLEAAQACLVRLRLYGSTTVGAERSDALSQAVAFLFDRFSPEVRIQAKIHALQNGTLQSGLADVWLADFPGDESGIREFFTSESHRALARKFDAAIQVGLAKFANGYPTQFLDGPPTQTNDRPNSQTAGFARFMRKRLQIAYGLRSEITQDTQLVGFVTREMAQGVANWKRYEASKPSPASSRGMGGMGGAMGGLGGATGMGGSSGGASPGMGGPGMGGMGMPGPGAYGAQSYAAIPDPAEDILCWGRMQLEHPIAEREAMIIADALVWTNGFLDSNGLVELSEAVKAKFPDQFHEFIAVSLDNRKIRVVGRMIAAVDLDAAFSGKLFEILSENESAIDTVRIVVTILDYRRPNNNDRLRDLAFSKMKDVLSTSAEPDALAFVIDRLAGWDRNQESWSSIPISVLKSADRWLPALERHSQNSDSPFESTPPSVGGLSTRAWGKPLPSISESILESAYRLLDEIPIADPTQFAESQQVWSQPDSARLLVRYFATRLVDDPFEDRPEELFRRQWESFFEENPAAKQSLLNAISEFSGTKTNAFAKTVAEWLQSL
jgi:serine/threonine protein kinase